MESSNHKYKVIVDDNFHHMDEGERYTLGEFDSCEQAITACKRIVDGFLLSSSRESARFSNLWEHYTAFGDDAFIVTTDPHCKFSGWEYARQRCIDIEQTEAQEHGKDHGS